MYIYVEESLFKWNRIARYVLTQNESSVSVTSQIGSPKYLIDADKKGFIIEFQCKGRYKQLATASSHLLESGFEMSSP